jgi:hypothetical protein
MAPMPESSDASDGQRADVLGGQVIQSPGRRKHQHVELAQPGDGARILRKPLQGSLMCAARSTSEFRGSTWTGQCIGDRASDR